MHTDLIEYQHGDTVLEGYLASHSSADAGRPSILICHAWGGRNDFVEERARDLAKLGFTAFALDVYGKGVQGSNPDENVKLMQPFVDDRALLRDRLLAGLETLCAQPQCDTRRVAAIGYCFGGLCVLDLARCGADLRGVVSFHGLLTPNGLNNPGTKAKVLVLHGWKDPMVPPEAVVAFAEEMTALGADWQVHGYGNAMHAFTNPEANDPGFGTVYEETTAKRSWTTMRNFLDEVFS